MQCSRATRSRRTMAVVGTLATTLALAGCGGGDDKPPASRNSGLAAATALSQAMKTVDPLEVLDPARIFGADKSCTVEPPQRRATANVRDLDIGIAVSHSVDIHCIDLPVEEVELNVAATAKDAQRLVQASLGTERVQKYRKESGSDVKVTSMDIPAGVDADPTCVRIAEADRQYEVCGMAAGRLYAQVRSDSGPTGTGGAIMGIQATLVWLKSYFNQDACKPDCDATGDAADTSGKASVLPLPDTIDLSALAGQTLDNGRCHFENPSTDTGYTHVSERMQVFCGGEFEAGAVLIADDSSIADVGWEPGTNCKVLSDDQTLCRHATPTYAVDGDGATKDEAMAMLVAVAEAIRAAG